MEVVGKDIQNFQFTVKEHSNYDFTDYSHTSLRRRLTRILLEMEMDMDHLTHRMASDEEFLLKIIRKITVHTTEMFRDPDVWKQIKNDLLPRFSSQPTIRIWHPGCSTGQEVYSMMMVLDELGLMENLRFMPAICTMKYLKQPGRESTAIASTRVTWRILIGLC